MTVPSIKHNASLKLVFPRPCSCLSLYKQIFVLRSQPRYFPSGEGCVYGGFNSNPKAWIHWQFCTKNIGIMYISYPKIWVTIFIERWVSISSFQCNNVLYSFGQHLLDSKLFSFWKQCPAVLCCPILVINLTARNLFWGITELNPRNLQLLIIFTHKNGKFMFYILDKKWLSSEIWDPKTWHAYPCIQIWQVPSPSLGLLQAE